MSRLIERGRLLLRDGAKTFAGAGSMPTAAGTLGAVLYANPPQRLSLESEWVTLIRWIAARDALALQSLYERVSAPVSALIFSIVADEKIAAALAIEVLQDVWKRADRYDATEGTVLAWVMNLARSKAREFPPREPAQASSGPTLTAKASSFEPAWLDVAPGISVKLFATDLEKHLVSMMVRLAPGTDYPPHTHAGVEELHLLEGELWIDDRKLVAGAYNRAEPGTGDKRVWSETGCTCVLITSADDLLR
jgi:RNA polymerase sigma-70 factor (ECF subfamily)